MSSAAFVLLLKRWGWIILCGAALGGAGAWFASQTTAPLYRARAYLSMIPADMDWRIRDLTKELARNAAARFPAAALLQEVRQELALDWDDDALAQTLHASFDNVTLVMTIEALHENPQLTAALADAAARSFFAERTAYFAERDFAGSVDFARMPSEPELLRLAPNATTNALAGLTLGAGVGLALVLLLLRREEERLARPDVVERALQAPVLGVLSLD